MDVESLLTLAIEIAEGLEAAHSQGIIHRDIKPPTSSSPNTSMPLDFGLAKALVRHHARRRGSSPVPAQHGTVSMSPEQVRGKDLDVRPHLFFGAVLYEMSTGTLPFRGETSGVLFESILNRAPAPAIRLNPTSRRSWKT